MFSRVETKLSPKKLRVCMWANVCVCGQMDVANKREISHSNVVASKSKIGWMWYAYFRWVHRYGNGDFVMGRWAKI